VHLKPIELDAMLIGGTMPKRPAPNYAFLDGVWGRAPLRQSFLQNENALGWAAWP
jgi:hypothetical protein